MVQYIKMFPAKEGQPGTSKRREEVNQMVKEKQVPLTDLGKKLLGLENW